jgi:hypothetical protein
MVAAEIKKHDFLVRQPTTRIVKAENTPMVTRSTGNCSIKVNLFYLLFYSFFSLPPFPLIIREVSLVPQQIHQHICVCAKRYLYISLSLTSTSETMEFRTPEPSLISEKTPHLILLCVLILFILNPHLSFPSRHPSLRAFLGTWLRVVSVAASTRFNDLRGIREKTRLFCRRFKTDS